MSPLSQVI
jgi:hypothetical protein